jgi:tRNA(Ile2)-agmatinylcytidine synthase
LLVGRMLQIGARFVDYPNLIRLNPNTPWKTRGNAAVCLRFIIDDTEQGIVKETILDLIDEYGEFQCDNTNPGTVFLVGEVPPEVKDFSKRVVQSIVELEEAERLIDEYGLSAVGWKNRRGVIGALAAVGGTLESDYTYELITYRTQKNRGTLRRVDPESVRSMNQIMNGQTFCNVDESGRPLITPHGPDPVLYGVRGESPNAVYKAFQLIKTLEPVERWMIYRSNQGTDAHFTLPDDIARLTPFNPAVVEGKVTSHPETITGGHVIFRISDASGAVDCAAYEPTGNFRNVVRKLLPGDHVRAYGGVRPIGSSLTLNLEKLEVLNLVEDVDYVNPRCPECGGGMESMGSQKGFRCRRCGFRGDDFTKDPIVKARKIVIGVYLPDLDAHRHLTKPLQRYGVEKNGFTSPMFTPWIG